MRCAVGCSSRCRNPTTSSVVSKKKRAAAAFYEWLEKIPAQVIDNPVWLREVSRICQRKEPKTDWQAQFGRSTPSAVRAGWRTTGEIR